MPMTFQMRRPWLVVALCLAGCVATRTTGNERQGEPAQFRDFTFRPSQVSPTPRCWIYDKVYPATEAAFESQHVTLDERKEIEKWAAPASPSQDRSVRARSPGTTPPSASEEHLVRWMRDPFKAGSVLVFVARPIERPPNGYSPWQALNANVIIDTVQCSVHAFPTA